MSVTVWPFDVLDVAAFAESRFVTTESHRLDKCDVHSGAEAAVALASFHFKCGPESV